MSERKDDFIVARTTKDLKNRVQDEAERDGHSLSKAVRELIEDGLKFRQLSRK